MKNVILLLLVLSAGFFISCKKTNKCNAGTGGGVTLDLVPQHHGKPIVNRSAYLDSAFIKFNATDLPGLTASAYDLVVVGKPGDDDIKVTGMQCGQYYIYMAGFDTTSFNARVVGGTPLNFSDQSGEKQIIVAVNE